MCNRALIQTVPVLLLLCALGCAGPDEGVYTGEIGNKKKVKVGVEPDGVVHLDGYWQERLSGVHEKGSLQGKDMDALVFEGPASKKFKLRMLYQEEGDALIIRAIQSRTYGPGARYLPTEKDSVFDPPPRLIRQAGS